MRPADRELVGAEVDHLVGGRARIERPEEGLQQQPRLVRQRAAGVEPEQARSRGSGGPTRARRARTAAGSRERGDVDGSAARERHGARIAAVLERVDAMAGGRAVRAGSRGSTPRRAWRASG